MASKLRLVSLFAVLAIAVGVLALNIGSGTKNASADNVANEYSLEAETGGTPVTGPFQTTVAVGGSVTVQLRVDFAGGGVCTGSPGVFGCYQAAQWRLNYDDGILTTTTAAITKVGAAPGACTSEAITLAGPASFALTGCLDLAGANLNYSGAVWNVPMTCDVAGVSPISLEPDTTSPGTFVDDGAALQPRHYHINDNNAGPQEPNLGAINCVNVADIVAAKTGPLTANAGAPIQYVVTGTNTGPATWMGGIVTDDLPDGADVSGCSVGPNTTCATLQMDTNGDSTLDGAPLPTCIFFPAFANPFPVPPPILTNLVICPASLQGVVSLPVGGKMVATINVASHADDCNDTFIDLGAALSDSPTAPNFGVPGSNLDPDFLDGVQGNEDNFAPFVTQIGDCPVSIVKAGPSTATVGDTGLNMTLTVSNAGPSQATNVVVTDVVDPGLDVTAVSAGCVEAPANTVTCTTASIPAGGNVVHTITFSTPNAGLFCNDASGTWTRGNATQTDADDVGTTTSNEICFTVLPPFNGLVKAVDINGDTDTDDPGEKPEAGEDTIEVNLWLCADQSTDGIDNNGDSTVDNEPATCDDEFVIEEQLFTPADCDSRNDDDDGDGQAVSNSPTIHPIADADLIDNDGDTVVDEPGERDPNVNIPNPDFNPLCPQPTLQDFIDNNVDKDGGELPEGIGAFEFQLKFDHKIFDITIDAAVPGIVPDAATDGVDNDGDTVVDNEPSAPTLLINCSMTIISENDIRFGCVTSDNPAVPGFGPGFAQVSGTVVATITVSPEADLQFRIRPGKDNGVVRRLLDENCEVADLLGGPLTALQDIVDGIDNDGDTIVDEPNENLQPNVGLTPDCTDIDITVRRLEGDLDMDCDVQVTDAQRIAFRYGAFFGQLLYDTFFDLEPFVTPDFDIDIKDLQFVFGRIGSTCDDPIPNSQEPQSANGVGQP